MPSEQHLVTRQVTRSSYPGNKLEMLTRVEKLASEYNTVLVTKLFKVRAGQLMQLRKNFRKDFLILVAKNKIASLALKKIGLKNSEELVSKLEGQNALIFTNMSPFKLFLVLEKSKVNLPARAGDVATEEILIPAGNTGIAPGPVLSEFKEARIQTRIEAGSIFVSRDSVVAHPGDVISPKLAGLLSRLNLKPIKGGLSIFMALSEGLLLFQKDIRIDLEQYRSEIMRSASEGVGLAIEASYFTSESLPPLFAKAERLSGGVAARAGYVNSENAASVLVFAESRARAVLSVASGKGFKALVP